MDAQRYKDALKELHALHQLSLEEHGAIDMSAGSEYVGYIIEEEIGYSIDIWSWGAHHGKMYGATIEEVKQKAHERYDMPLVESQIHNEVEAMEWPDTIG